MLLPRNFDFDLDRPGVSARSRHALVCASLALLVASCGGGGGDPRPAPATVAITDVTPADGRTRVPVDTRPSVSFSVTGGSYAAHTVSLACDGVEVAVSSSVSGNAITVTPASNLPFGRYCALSAEITATPGGASPAIRRTSFTTAGAPIPPTLYSYLKGEIRALNLSATTRSPRVLVSANQKCFPNFDPLRNEVHVHCEDAMMPNAFAPAHYIHVPGTDELRAGLPALRSNFVTGPELFAESGLSYHVIDAGGPVGQAPAFRFAVLNPDRTLKKIVVPPSTVTSSVRSMTQVGGKIQISLYGLAPPALGADPWPPSLSFDLATESFGAVEPATGTVLFAVPAGAESVVAGFGKIYVTGLTQTAVAVFDGVTGVPIGQLVLAEQAGAGRRSNVLSILPTADAVFVATINGIHKFSATTLARLAISTTCPTTLLASTLSARMAAYSEKLKRVYVSCTGVNPGADIELDDNLQALASFERLPKATTTTLDYLLIE